MNNILLKDLLHFSPDELSNVKIKFNQHNGEHDPLELYMSDPEIVNTQWLFWKEKRRYFQIGQIAICLVKFTDDKWLLTTIKRVTKDIPVIGGIGFEGTEVDQYKSLFGRVIVQYHKTSMAQGRYFSEIQDELIVNQILPERFDGFSFPGYDNVCLSYSQLRTIIERGKMDWIAALRSQKAVYLIVDKHTGKQYVGSATSDNGMLLQRWSDYVANGHGGNKELVALIERKGFDYVKQHFQYAILENFNANVHDSLILARESWWKETLQSRVWGYNAN